MGDSWYKTRDPNGPEKVSKALRVFLTPQEWAIFDGLAKEEEWSRARMGGHIISDWIKRTVDTTVSEPLLVRVDRQLKRDRDEAKV